MTMSLVTFDVAKRHLKVDHNDDDTEIEDILNRASGSLLDYLKKPSDYWQDTAGAPAGVPEAIRAGVLLMIGAMYENREGDVRDPDPLSQAVKDLVHRHRDPALA